MRAMFALVLLVGLGLAGFAVHMAQNYVESYQTALAKERQTKQPAIKTTDIYVANASLKFGEKLEEKHVLKIKWPDNSMPKGVFLEKDDLFPNDNAEPRLVTRPMEPGEPIMAIKITKPGEDAGLTTRLQKGTRAFAIRVDVASGVSGFLRPGDRVDVYWTGTADGAEEGNRSFTKLIQAGVDLIAIDQTVDTDSVEGSIARTVTVAVKPEQVAALAQAQNSGKLSLSLVGALDDTVAETVEVDQMKLLGIERAEKKVVEIQEKPKVCTIRTRRGAEVVEIAIPCSN
ncbi:Flp pilus assembly protein CpaB [Cognatishimia sp. SS12]|uniref:Flp pilus assembly protein CpaB n=1 Tax=Cognatishimia sp. SS12 TaxID=2979465 RepID=UPI00232BA5E7|nr:Flp pilus assembly protein CpaB [Cognatishimia sp. SS12]MDC0738216.1 Flp pilus assembly protein CpaB [Cognatishimia sp. SS12]